MLKEFRDFAMRGNVVDMAVGIIIGAAFGKVVSSLVNDVIMPPIGMVLGNVPFSDLTLALNEKTAIKYGVFINTVLDFVIVAFCMFLVIRQMNRLTAGFAPKGEPTTKTCPQCMSTIPINAVRCAFCTLPLEK